MVVEYTYEGLGAVVQVENKLPTNPVVTKYLASAEGAPEKLGFDPFGRVYRIKAQAGSETLMGYTYAYDYTKSAFAPVSRQDGGPLSSSQTQRYAYDGMERLVEFKLGADENNPDYVESWSLTAVGNWKRVSDSQTTDERLHNKVNEIKERKINGTAVKPEIAGTPPPDSYDGEGNLREVPADNASGTSDYFTFTYDAWNRLVKIEKGGTVLSDYRRDALGRIAWDTVSGEHYYWSAGWQRLAVYDESDNLTKEEIWGARYVDEIVCAIDYTGTSPTYRHYVQDANWNVVAIWDPGDTGDSLELVTYSPYGTPTFWKKDGSWQATSQLASRKDADHLFQGRWLRAFASGGLDLQIYHFRYRVHLPTLGRFAQRDPLGRNVYNTYAFVGLNPIAYVDPQGLRYRNSIRTYHGIRINLGHPESERIVTEINAGDYLSLSGKGYEGEGHTEVTNEFQYFGGFAFLGYHVWCDWSLRRAIGSYRDENGCCFIYGLYVHASKDFLGERCPLWLYRKTVNKRIEDRNVFVYAPSGDNEAMVSLGAYVLIEEISWRVVSAPILWWCRGYIEERINRVGALPPIPVPCRFLELLADYTLSGKPEEIASQILGKSIVTPYEGPCASVCDGP